MGMVPTTDRYGSLYGWVWYPLLGDMVSTMEEYGIRYGGVWYPPSGGMVSSSGGHPPEHKIVNPAKAGWKRNRIFLRQNLIFLDPERVFFRLYMWPWELHKY